MTALIPKLKPQASIYCFFATQFLTDFIRIGEHRILDRFCVGIELLEKYATASKARLEEIKGRYGKFTNQMSIKKYFKQ